MRNTPPGFFPYPHNPRNGYGVARTNQATPKPVKEPVMDLRYSKLKFQQALHSEKPRYIFSGRVKIFLKPQRIPYRLPLSANVTHLIKIPQCKIQFKHWAGDRFYHRGEEFRFDRNYIQEIRQNNRTIWRRGDEREDFTAEGNLTFKLDPVTSIVRGPDGIQSNLCVEFKKCHVFERYSRFMFEYDYRTEPLTLPLNYIQKIDFMHGNRKVGTWDSSDV